MNFTTQQYHQLYDFSSIHFLFVGIALFILALILIETDKHLQERLTLPEDCDSPEDLVHFIHKGDKFTLTRENKDMFDALLPRDKDLFCKNVKKHLKARVATEKERSANLNKFSNKKEDREAVLK